MEFIFRENQPNLKSIVSPPMPSRNAVPDWYKKIRPNKELPNVKACAPFLDALTSGYTQVTWADIEITSENETPEIVISSEIPMIKYREVSSVPTTDEYYQIEFTWLRHWVPLLPDGYSAIVTHPLNRLDLPFTTISGIVDFDTALPIVIGQVPFYLKKNFTGTIPAGTPMFQMFPIRRENWESIVKDFDPEIAAKEEHYISSFESSPYKSQMWHKKEYN
jgi:hypothetical protein